MLAEATDLSEKHSLEVYDSKDMAVVVGKIIVR